MSLFGLPDGLMGGSKETSYTTSSPTSRLTQATTSYSTSGTTNYNSTWSSVQSTSALSAATSGSYMGRDNWVLSGGQWTANVHILTETTSLRSSNCPAGYHELMNNWGGGVAKAYGGTNGSSGTVTFYIHGSARGTVSYSQDSQGYSEFRLVSWNYPGYGLIDPQGSSVTFNKVIYYSSNTSKTTNYNTSHNTNVTTNYNTSFITSHITYG